MNIDSLLEVLIHHVLNYLNLKDILNFSLVTKKYLNWSRRYLLNECGITPTLKDMVKIDLDGFKSIQTYLLKELSKKYILSGPNIQTLIIKDRIKIKEECISLFLNRNYDELVFVRDIEKIVKVTVPNSIIVATSDTITILSNDKEILILKVLCKVYYDCYIENGGIFMLKMVKSCIDNNMILIQDNIILEEYSRTIKKQIIIDVQNKLKLVYKEMFRRDYSCDPTIFDIVHNLNYLQLTDPDEFKKNLSLNNIWSYSDEVVLDLNVQSYLLDLYKILPLQYEIQFFSKVPLFRRSESLFEELILGIKVEGQIIGINQHGQKIRLTEESFKSYLKAFDVMKQLFERFVVRKILKPYDSPEKHCFMKFSDSIDEKIITIDYKIIAFNFFNLKMNYPDGFYLLIFGIHYFFNNVKDKLEFSMKTILVC